MKRKLSREEFEKITYLVDCAVTAPNKTEAKKYIDLLKFLSQTALEANGNILFSDLISSSERASGRVADKERLVSFVRMDLFKLEHFVEEQLHALGET